MSAMRRLDKARTKSGKNATDNFYANHLVLRSQPVEQCLRSIRRWPLPITSINEGRLLLALGVSEADRHQIEGLKLRRGLPGAADLPGAQALVEEQLALRAIVRLAREPPSEVGVLQRQTRDWLLRPFPLGLRFSGKNMSPLPCWLAGAQSVALNMSPVAGRVDWAMQLHFALFESTGGYVLKPAEMVTPPAPRVDVDGQQQNEDEDEDKFWPPPRTQLSRTTVEIISLHNAPKTGERRPRFNGSRGVAHNYVPTLSGKFAPPNMATPSSPEVTISLHPIGGFCAVSRKLPMPMTAEPEMSTAAVSRNGMNAAFGDVMHCVAAEPHSTFIRVGVTDTSSSQEIAFETAVLGRLRRGYRIFQCRGPLGTRIELAYLFVRIQVGQVSHFWQSPRQLRLQSVHLDTQRHNLQRQLEEKAQLANEVIKLHNELNLLKRSTSVLRQESTSQLQLNRGASRGSTLSSRGSTLKQKQSSSLIQLERGLSAGAPHTCESIVEAPGELDQISSHEHDLSADVPRTCAPSAEATEASCAHPSDASTPLAGSDMDGQIGNTSVAANLDRARRAASGVNVWKMVV